MANPSGRNRPTYEPNSQLFEQLLDQSGKSIVDYAYDINCGETTLRKLLAAEKVAAETLKSIADKLKRHWHDLLSEHEKKRIGISQKADAVASNQLPSFAIKSPTIGGSSSVYSAGLFQLPAELTDFVGREKHIVTLAEHLRGNQNGIRTSVLCGMGGIGKSCLAVTVAYKVRDCFPDAQLFIDLRGTADGIRANPLTPAEAMTRVIRAFHPDTIRLPNDDQELEVIYRSVLAGRRALILLDNAKSEEQLKPLLTAASPTGFLVTSRIALALDGAFAHQLDLLSKVDAQTLLRRIVGDKGSTAELNRIAQLCGFLPLAIRVAGDFLRLKDDWSVARYVEALDRERLRWLRIGSDPSKHVEAVLKMSSAHFVRDSLDRATRWHLLHVFNGDFDLSGAASAWNLDDDNFAVLDDLSEMRNRSLIIYDAKTARYHLHDLMRPIAEALFGCRKKDKQHDGIHLPPK